MIRLGHVYSNWMVDVALTNEKLRRRGLRILQEASSATDVRGGAGADGCGQPFARGAGDAQDENGRTRGSPRTARSQGRLEARTGRVDQRHAPRAFGTEERRATGKLGKKFMDRFRITGGKPLEGTVRISGAKNAALPTMAAALLTAEPVHLKNIPRVRDIITMGQVIAHTNARVETPDVPPTDLTIEARNITDAEAPYELVRTMRASILTLGPLVARLGHARVSLPGGCAIGARPVDLHIKALEQMGAEISTEHGYVTARVPGGRLRGADIHFEKITVTGTENILMAAALAEGETRLENSAREPEVTDLVELLIKMGARIEGAGTSTLVVQRRGAARRRVAHDYSRPHRGRDVRGGRRHYRRRHRGHRLQSGTFQGGARQALRDGRGHRGRGHRSAAGTGSQKADGGERHNRGISGLCHRHAGTTHGAGNTGTGRVRVSPRRFSRTASCTRAK